MCWTIIIGFGTTIPFVLALLFSVHDLDAIASSALPILEVFYQATGYSRSAGTFFTFWVLLNYFGAMMSCLATAGRLTWAFSCDNGLPYSSVFAQVHSTLQTPINAMAVCGVFCVLYGLIYIGSTTAFNSIVSVAILALNVSYAVPQGIVLFRGRNKVLPTRSFRLGSFGILVNAFSCLWCAFYTIIFCFPTTLPAEVGSMNYVSVVIVGIILLILISWYGGKRKTFTGPVSSPFPPFFFTLIRSFGDDRHILIDSRTSIWKGWRPLKSRLTSSSRHRVRSLGTHPSPRLSKKVIHHLSTWFFEFLKACTKDNVII